MSWPLAILLCFTVLVFSILGFLLIIYFKEFSREDEIIKQYQKKKIEQETLAPVYVLTTIPDPNAGKQAPSQKLEAKDKKGLN